MKFKSLDWQECAAGKKLTLLVASGFGLGLSPVASGTAGTLLGVPIAAALCAWTPLGVQIAAALVLAALAIPVCDAAERHFGQKDDHRIVADEYLTFPICMLGLPADPLTLAIAFVTNRACDVIKPPPARGLQRLRGGLGVVIDDVFAALYSLALNHAIHRLIARG